MSRHLNVDRWFDFMPTTGNLRMKRVSKIQEKHFPKIYREVYRDGWINPTTKNKLERATALTRFIQIEKGCSLSEAWAKVKYMFNC